jgi:DNA modification methylase
VVVFRNGRVQHVNNVKLGRYGRNRTNVWTYEGVNTLNPGRRGELALHPTVKPVALVVDAIRDCSHRGNVILDPFIGSGTTLIAAEETRRRCCGIEIDPAYVDTAIRRWEQFTGGAARHAVSGRTFEAMGLLERPQYPLLPAPDTPRTDEED